MAAKRSAAAAANPAAPQKPDRIRTAVKAASARPAAELDRLIHERMRLAIVSALAVNEALSFNELKALLETTDGNLSVHARKLEEAGYVTCTKSFEGRVPRTEYRLTAAGRRALDAISITWKRSSSTRVPRDATAESPTCSQRLHRASQETIVKDDARLPLFDALEQFLAALRRPDQLKVEERFRIGLDALDDDAMSVDEEDRDRHIGFPARPRTR